MPWHHGSIVLRLLALLALSEFVRTGFFVPFLPLHAKSIGLTAAGIGWIVGLHYLADGLTKGPAGVLAERIGLGRIALAGALMGTVAVVLVPYVPSVLPAVLMTVAWGLTITTLWPSVMTAVSYFAKEGKQSRALSWASVAAAPAIGLGIVGVGLLMQRVPAVAYPVLVGAQIAALLVAFSLVGLRLPRTSKQAQPYRWARVAVLIPAAFAQTLAPGLLVTIFYPYLRALNVSIVELLLPGLLAVLVGLVGIPLAGRLADRGHPRRALLPGLMLLATTFALLGTEGIAGKLWVVAPVAGLAYALFLTGWNGLVARTLPQEHRTAAWGTIMAIEALGYAVGPVLGGFAWDRFGMQGPFWLGALVFALVQVYYLLPWQERSRDAQKNKNTSVL